MKRLPACARPGSRGTGTLPLLLVMLLGATVLLLYLNRALVAEQRAAAAGLRSAAAFAAAEAGQHWALALLNHTAAVDGACAPAPAASGAPWRERLLAHDASTGRWLPTGIDAACVLVGDAAPRCNCPTAGTAALPPADNPSGMASVRISLTTSATPSATPTLLELASQGCVDPRGGCTDPDSTDALARVHLSLARVPTVPAQLAATLVAGGAVDLAGTVSINQPDAASGGLAVLAGGPLTAEPGVRLQGPAGSSGAQGATIERDPRWPDAERFFRAHLGVARSRAASAPVFMRVDCAAACTGAAVDAALARGARAIWLSGALQATSPAWGSAEHPLLLVVDGSLQLSGPAQLQGLVLASQVEWRNTEVAAGRLDGALLAAADALLAGRIDLRYQPALLARVAEAAAVYAPVPGSWRDVAP